MLINGKKHLTPCADIELFESLKEAQKNYEFLDRVKLEQELQNLNTAK